MTKISWFMLVGVIGGSGAALALTGPQLLSESPPLPQPPTEHSVITTGKGEARGKCDGSAEQKVCFELLKEAAEQEGQTKADDKCLALTGTGETSTCLTQCNPAQLDTGAHLQEIHCQSTCKESCRLSDDPNG